MSGTITFTGLSTDQSLNEIIDALVSARRAAHIEPLEGWKATWETKLEAITSIDSALSSFYAAARAIDRVEELLVKTGSSSHENILTASANSAATPGTHTVIVNQLAQAETEVHQGIKNSIIFHSGVVDQTASINDSGADKMFAYSYDGIKRTITVNSGDTLQNLCSDINADGQNPGVTAKIVTSGGKDHLVLVETNPDSSKAIMIDPDGDMTLNGSENTVNLTGSSFSQTINGSGTDKTFQITYGLNAAIQIPVSPGTTLEGLRDLINNASIGLTAWILDDGSAGSGCRHLVISGENTGDDYTIELNSTGATTLDGSADTEDFTGLVFVESSSAQNAQLRVDGYPPADWIQRTTNSIPDVLQGVRLDLTQPDPAKSVTVTIGTDKAAIMEKIEEFREAFNGVRTVIRDVTTYDPNTKQAGSLLGNYAVQIIKSRLDNLITSPAPGFRDQDDTYVNLQQLGFYTDENRGSETEGLLLLDASKLQQALDSNPEAVASVFSAYFSGVSNNAQITFSSALPTASPGIYDVEVNTDTEQGRFRLQEGGWGDWVALEGSSGNYSLTGTTGPEKGIALYISCASNTGNYSAEVRVRNGIITQMSTELENLLSTSGPLYALDKNYNDIMENIDRKISNEERRLLIYEERLRQRFSRLDAYISQMEQLGNFLTMFAANSSKTS